MQATPRIPVPHLSLSVHLTPHQQAAAAGVGLFAVAASVVWVVLRKPGLTPEQIEHARRERLARTGRITDGSLVDTTMVDGSFLGEAARTDDVAPHKLMFQYGIAGVRYEAVQDVSALQDRVRGVQIDLPIQVRYDHLNPADSIVVAEDWTGLRLRRGDEDGKQGDWYRCSRRRHDWVGQATTRRSFSDGSQIGNGKVMGCRSRRCRR